MTAKHSSVLVVGGGMSGITAAVEAAELGREVYLVERAPSLGGRVSAMKSYFPKLCPPACGLEINYQRIRKNPRIQVFTSTRVTAISGEPGDLQVELVSEPSYVKESCTDPITPFQQLPAELSDDFNYGLSKKRPAGLVHPHAFPSRPVVDPRALEDEKLRSLLQGVEQVDLEQQPQKFTLQVGAVVWATGWVPYDASRIDYLGYSEFADVVSNVEFERLAAPDGPTGGKLLRPSDGKECRRVAFIQCAGSRDVNHLPYCSAVCCLASLKQATYVREAYSDSQVWIFYIDIRANKYEAFYQHLQEDANIHFVKGKVGLVEGTSDGSLHLLAENIAAGGIESVDVDLVVLATGMVPSTRLEPVPCQQVQTDEYGFVVSDPAATGIVATGCAKRPADVATCVQDATAAALLATLR